MPMILESNCNRLLMTYLELIWFKHNLIVMSHDIDSATLMYVE